MYVRDFLRAVMLLSATSLLLGCQPPNFSQLKDAPTSLFENGKKFVLDVNNLGTSTPDVSSIPLGEILNGSLANKNNGTDFVSVVKYALDTDPNIISARRDIEAKVAAAQVGKAQKKFQVGTTIYGGIEDITDNTKGIAVGLNASRLVYDGGELDSQIESANLEAVAAIESLTATIDKRAFEILKAWLELEKYKALQGQIKKRLAVLDPLIVQLEQVAKAGIGDVSKVTAAQRTVSAIRVEQTTVAEGLAQARLEFSNAFGIIDDKLTFDYNFISNLVPDEIDDKLVQNSPLLLSQYASYQAAVAKVKTLEAKDGFDVGFEARAMRPFAGSGYDSDESIGLVGRKTLYNGGMLESEIKEAEAIVEAREAQIRATYRQGARSVHTALQNIASMNKAILVARENAKLTADEIVYLKQQLIIGGSTLDSVLSAEATLYAAESKEVTYLTEKYKSELAIVSTLGLLSDALGF